MPKLSDTLRGLSGEAKHGEQGYIGRLTLTTAALRDYAEQALVLEELLEKREAQLNAIHPIVNGSDENNWRDCMWEIQKLAFLCPDAVSSADVSQSAPAPNHTTSIYKDGVTTGTSDGEPEPKLYTQDEIDRAYNQGFRDGGNGIGDAIREHNEILRTNNHGEGF